MHRIDDMIWHHTMRVLPAPFSPFLLDGRTGEPGVVFHDYASMTTWHFWRAVGPRLDDVARDTERQLAALLAASDGAAREG